MNPKRSTCVGDCEQAAVECVCPAHAYLPSLRNKYIVWKVWKATHKVEFYGPELLCLR